MTLAPAIVASPELQHKTGYDLKDVLDMSVDHFGTTTHSHIDKTRADLEQEGWMGKKFIEQEGKPIGNKHSITKTGRAGPRRGMALPLTGARSLEHLETNLGITGLALGPEFMARLDQVSQPDLPSPMAFSRPLGHNHA